MKSRFGRLQKSIYSTTLMLVLSGMSACNAAPQISSGEMAAGDAAPGAVDPSVNQAMAAKVAASPSAEADAASATSEPTVPAALPQLIKRANMRLVVDSVDEALDKASGIIRQNSGDILDLQDTQPEAGQRRNSYMRVRIPQNKLEPTLNALGQLGTIAQRSITAEDVSSQLVDLEARVRNLRKSEEALLKLMDRSGSIANILEVSRELSSVRQQIEQIDAQLKNLKNQVSYSTIEVSFESAVANLDQPRPVGESMGATWQEATQSVRSFSVGLLRLGLWLLAYSPYLALALLLGMGGYRLVRRPRREVVEVSGQE
jgi:Domain of unknown function (DUF4349)